MAAITAGGIGSGIDVEGLVRQLVAAEGQPTANRIDAREAKLQANLSAFGSVKNALSRFQDSVKALQNMDTLLTRKGTSSNTESFTVSVDKNAVAGNYAIQVQQLAQAAKVRSGDFDSANSKVGSGSLNFSLGDKSFSVTADADTSLAGLRDAINSASGNPGITASIINVDGGSRLILSSNKVGADNAISVAATSTAGANEGLNRLNTANLVTLDAAQDAILLVDQQQVTRGTNQIKDVISGVTFNLLKADAEATETLSVALDNNAVKAKVDAFVKAYNSMMDATRPLSAYNAETGAAGVLLGDATLRGIQSQIRQTLTNAVPGLDISTLAELGITTTENGNLQMDALKLEEVVNSDFSAIANLFASDNGIAKNLNAVLDRYTGSSGLLNTRTEGLQSRIGALGDERERLDSRLEALETRYRKQFTAMDILVGQLQGLSSYLQQQLENLPQPNSIRRR